MKTLTTDQPTSWGAAKLLPLCVAIVLFSACASTPTAPAGSAEARAKLSALRTNSELATRAPVEIQAAEVAVTAAERPRDDEGLEQHLVLIAGQQVDIARSWAQTRLYEDQRTELAARREAVRLDARTREAELARNDASRARSAAEAATAQAEAARAQASAATAQAAAARREASDAQNQAAVAQSQTALALSEASAARTEAEELQRQLAELNAQITDRGMVVTLGDVMFETGMSELRGGTPANLDHLVAFLKRFENRSVIIEGHTDSVGSESSNLALSQRRADSVQRYLVNNGISMTRISSTGLGENSPIADNESPTGRQQNRRVEVIISNPPE